MMRPTRLLSERLSKTDCASDEDCDDWGGLWETGSKSAELATLVLIWGGEWGKSALRMVFGGIGRTRVWW